VECNIIYTCKYIVTAYKTYVYIHAVRLTTCTRYSVLVLLLVLCYAKSCAQCGCQDDYQILSIFGMCTLPRMFGHIIGAGICDAAFDLQIDRIVLDRPRYVVCVLTLQCSTDAYRLDLHPSTSTLGCNSPIGTSQVVSLGCICNVRAL